MNALLLCLLSLLPADTFCFDAAPGSGTSYVYLSQYLVDPSLTATQDPVTYEITLSVDHIWPLRYGNVLMWVVLSTDLAYTPFAGGILVPTPMFVYRDTITPPEARGVGDTAVFALDFGGPLPVPIYAQVVIRSPENPPTFLVLSDGIVMLQNQCQ